MFNRFNKMVNRMIKNFNYYNYKRSFDESLDIKREDIENYIKMGATIVDVRSPQEYREGHIDGAINLPEYNIRRNVQNILPDKNQLIILYCSVGERSKMAQNKLKRLGYTNVYTVYEGIGDALFFLLNSEKMASSNSLDFYRK